MALGFLESIDKGWGLLKEGVVARALEGYLGVEVDHISIFIQLSLDNSRGAGWGWCWAR